jgi:site-specific DNA recombinase
MNPVTELRMALYARVSSERQAEQQTIASQVAALRQRLRADGGVLDGELEFIDDGYTGSTLLRPALERLRDHAAQGALDRLYVLAPDRLARNYAHQFLLVEEMRRAGVEVVFLNRALGQSPEDDLLLQVQGIIAEYERAQISERCRRGRQHAARTGQVSVLAGAPYGYRYIRKHEGGGQARYEVVAEQARVVQQIFAWVGRERLALREVCRRLEQQGEPSPAGQPYWHPSTVANLLRNPAYQGRAAWGKRRRLPRRGRLRPARGQSALPRTPYSSTCLETESLPVPVPALVSAEDFAAAAEQLVENQRRNRQGRTAARYLLQGLTVCGRCGYAFLGVKCSRSPRVPHRPVPPYVYYRCGSCAARTSARPQPCRLRAVRAEVLEEAVWQDVCRLLRQPELIAQEYARRLQTEPGTAGTRGPEPLARLIAKVKRSISRLIDLYSEGLIDKEEVQPRVQAAKDRLHRLEAEQRAAADAESQEVQVRLALTRLQDFAGRVQEELAAADWTKRRDIIRTVVKRIEVHETEVRIVYRVAPVPFVERPARGDLQDCPRVHFGYGAPKTAQRSSHPTGRLTRWS